MTASEFSDSHTSPDAAADSTATGARKSRKPRGRANAGNRKARVSEGLVREILDTRRRVENMSPNVFTLLSQLADGDVETPDDLTVALATEKVAVSDVAGLLARVRSDDPDTSTAALIELGAASPTDLKSLWDLANALEGSAENYPRVAQLKVATRLAQRIRGFNDDAVDILDSALREVSG